MNRPLALDLYSCAGGAGTGLYRAGFDVVGLDIRPSPRYPFAFVQGDALRPPFDLSRFSFIWASPPCQSHSSMKTMHNAKRHADLIPATRALLKASGVPYVIENVVGAPLENPIMLCGSMFGLGTNAAELHRHRIFETSFPVLAPQCQHNARKPVVGVYGGHVRNRRRRDGSNNRGVADFPIAEGQRAMQIDWMSLTEMSQAIPPAYSEWLARHVYQSLRACA